MGSSKSSKAAATKVQKIEGIADQVIPPSTTVTPTIVSVEPSEVTYPSISKRPYYPRALKLQVVQAVQKGERCHDVAIKFGLRNTQVVYSMLAWNRNQGNHGLTVHGLGTYLTQCAPEDVMNIPIEPHNKNWSTTEASDNLKMLHQFKFNNEGLRLSPSQAATLKTLLESVEEKRKSRHRVLQRKELQIIGSKPKVVKRQKKKKKLQPPSSDDPSML
jgi:hypothetical protein